MKPDQDAVGVRDRIKQVLRSRPITLRVPQVYNDPANGNPWGLFADDLEALLSRLEKAEGALGKIDAIRNSIIGCQKVNWSEHVYPLVAALGEAGYEGQDYETTRENVGTLIERTNAAEARAVAAEARLSEALASPLSGGGKESSNASPGPLDATRHSSDETPEPSGPVNCTYVLRRQGKAYPRTCERCRLGPCPFYNNDGSARALGGAS